MGRREQLQKKLAQRARREKTLITVFPKWACGGGDRIVVWSGRTPTDEEIRDAIAAADEAEHAQRPGVKQIEAQGRDADERRRTLEARAAIEANREHAKQAATIWRRCEKCRTYMSMLAESTRTLCERCSSVPLPQPTHEEKRHEAE